MCTRWVIVDDHEGFLQTARRVLVRQGLNIVGVARTSSDALASARDLAPDGFLVDVDLGRESGFELARRLTSPPHVSLMVILISTHDESEFAMLIAESGAIGYVTKSRLSARAVSEIVVRHHAGRPL